jgi:hypothetical protein
MKKRLKFIAVFLGIIAQILVLGYGGENAFGKFYGEFGDGTSKSDTVYISFSTWDTLGYSADADTYFVRRFYHGTLIDSTFGTATTNRMRTGYYEIPRRALNSTNYGQYEVEIEWHKQAKIFKTNGTYLVRDGDLENTPQNIEEIKAKTENLPPDPADDSDIDAQLSTIQTDLDNPDQYKADVSGLSTFDHTSDEVRVVSTDTIKAEVLGEVNVASSDTMNALVLDKTGFSLTPDYMTKADSSLYMRTDWDNIKNPTAYQNFTQTRFHFVDSLGEELTFTSVDSVRKVHMVDSLDQTVTAEVDTSQIKTMNENNEWGAFYTWTYPTRTLTSGAGTGANSVIIRCKDSSDSSAIAFAQIQVLDSVESATIGLLTSDSQGRGFFALDNGRFCVRMYKPGWQFTVPETLQVNGNEDTIYYADAFDPGLPPQASLCRVYGWVYDINDLPEVGAKIEASIKTVPLRYQNVLISPYYKTTTTDDEGYWYLDLYPNSTLNPSDTRYIFFIYSPSGTILRIEVTVPNQASWELQW